ATASGATALAKGGNGVRVSGGSGQPASGNLIGGTAAGARNVISGNAGHGIELTGAAAPGNTIPRNYIGTPARGAADLGNVGRGIELGAGADGTVIGGTAVG